ncbi:uracil-DNA glycosylase [Piscinibacter sp. HJYY11]|uniref:uracil-DNA glycosylase n=1 Tax=Piscinibacter sp. HJYY11 TaxID=2801333 RepID=UPI00192024B0|nr:uracil-DNA glycosylase [Piscinibacter sp. HJYY11]MBL0729685.1 uracil-DNA glycosylase [Piscinibacter sp. HJYY11]
MTADDLRAAFGTVPEVWRKVLPGWTVQKQEALIERIKGVSGDKPIGPEDPFRALRLVSPQDAKVVIFGQDPYPTAGHADGLAFSAGHGKPRSLARIFEVLAADRPGWTPPAVWKLDPWARQGVLLLNPALTVEIGQAGSHLKTGWLALTSEIVSALSQRGDPPTFLLWGGKAQDFLARAVPSGATPRVLITRHPSYDLHKQFMADGSHFLATQHLVDWWAL